MSDLSKHVENASPRTPGIQKSIEENSQSLSQGTHNDNDLNTGDNKSQPLLALPSTDGSPTHQLDLSGARGGAKVKLDHLGPLVVNEDGTLSRIANWDQMAEIEKRNTLRVLGKRNQQRLAALRRAEQAENHEENDKNSNE